MIPLEHIQRILGDVGGTDPYSLLGLTPETCTSAQIEESLRRRIAATYMHDSSDSDEVEQVRSALRAAADELRQPARRRLHDEAYRARAGHVLTPFDRAVLAILVASGGWNALSRARLVALAASRGITVQGLMKVISGLSQYARTGGPRLAMAQIASSQPRLSSAGLEQGRLTQLAQAGQALFERFTPAWRESSARSTLMLSMFFGVLALIVGVLASGYFVVTMTEPAATPPPSEQGAGARRPPAMTAPDERPGSETTSDMPRERPNAPLNYPQWPTFRVEWPAAITDARLRTEEVPDELESLSSRLLVGTEASDAIFHMWDALIDDVAASWLLLDDDLLRRIEDGAIDVLYVASDSVSTRDRLLRTFVPPDVRFLEPVDVWRGTWKIGMLARISRSDLLPPAVIDDARAQWRVAMQYADVDRRELLGPDASRRRWLDAARAHHIERNDIEHFAFWECWLTAQRRASTREGFYAAVADAVRQLLTRPRAFFEYGDPVRVLGRLIETLDFGTSPATKDGILPLMTEERLSAEGVHVLTSLLAQAPGVPWFTDEFVLSAEADALVRRRVAERVERAWPDLTVIASAQRLADAGLNIDEVVAGAWRELFDRVVALEGGLPEADNMRRLVAATRLNEAAVLLAQQHPHRAEQTLIALESLLDDSQQLDADRRRSTTNPQGRAAPAEPDQPRVFDHSADTEWARAYQLAGRDVNSRVDLLNELRERDRRDLSNDAASTFVREVYRGVPREVRETAQSVLLDRFHRSPNVALEMLDQFVDVPRTRMRNELISRYTGRVLPAARRDGWRVEARRALTEHLVSLWFPKQSPIVRLAADLSQSHEQQSAALRGSGGAVSAQPRPTDAIARLLASWREQAESLEPRSHVVPADRSDLAQRHQTRLHAAHDSIQQYIAHQISILEWIAYIASVEQPALVEHIEALLAGNALHRADVSAALEQAWHVERGIAALWHLRFFPTNDEQRRATAGTLRRDAVQSPRETARSSDSHQDNPWAERLEALRPSQPMAYFELAEDIADAARTDADRQLAQRLFALAGRLDPDRLAASAALALSELVGSEQHRMRLLALAAMLNPAMSTGADSAEWSPGRVVARFDEATALELTYAFSAYRQGDGRRVAELLNSDAGDLLDALPAAVPGGRLGLIERSRTFARGQRPTLSSERLERMVRVERAILAGAADRTWLGELLLHGNAPLIEADPNRLDELLNVDIDRPFYRDGRWVARALPR